MGWIRESRREPSVSRWTVMNLGRIAPLSLALAGPFMTLGCGGAGASARDAPSESAASADEVDGLGPFRLGMSAVELRLACAEHDGSDWSPNQHAFSRGCEVTLELHDITFQRFEMRLDGPSGNLVRLRGHADNANERAARRAFPDAEVVVVGDVVLVTLEAAPTLAPDEAAHPLE